MRLPQAGSSVTSTSATAIPSGPGICRSSTATSGRCRRAIASASALEAAWATPAQASGPRGRLSHDLQVFLDRQQGGKCGTDQVLVVGQQNADHGPGPPVLAP